MKRIAQLDENGCGVAAVAMIAGVSYKTACQLMFPGKNGTYTTERQLRTALATYGLKLGTPMPLGTKSFSDLQCNGIFRAKIEWYGKKWTHWVVWNSRSGALLDPYDTPGVSMRRVRLLKFLPVSRRAK
jgi:hypothetical protein